MLPVAVIAAATLVVPGTMTVTVGTEGGATTAGFLCPSSAHAAIAQMTTPAIIAGISQRRRRAATSASSIRMCMFMPVIIPAEILLCYRCNAVADNVNRLA